MDRTQTPPAQVHFDIAGDPSTPKDETAVDVPKKKGFLSGLLRRASLAGGKKPLLKKVGVRSLMFTVDV